METKQKSNPYARMIALSQACARWCRARPNHGEGFVAPDRARLLVKCSSRANRVISLRAGY